MTADTDDARRMLVKLISKLDDGLVVGVEELSERDKLFLINTCSAKLIESTICETCGYDTFAALEGLDALMGDMREQIIKRCEKHNE